MLFMCKIKGESRRFRVKFAATPNQPSPEICKTAVDVLESIFPIKNASDLSLDTQKASTQVDSNSQNSMATCESSISITGANTQNPSVSEAQSKMPSQIEMLPQHPAAIEACTVSNTTTQFHLQVPPVVGDLPSTVLPVQPTLPLRVDHAYVNDRCDGATVVMEDGEQASLSHSSAMGSCGSAKNVEIQLGEYFSNARTCSDLVKVGYYGACCNTL